MKKQARITIIVFLALASLGSFVFLNTVNTMENTSKVAVEEVYEQTATKAILSDVKIVEKIMDAGKRFIPAF